VAQPSLPVIVPVRVTRPFSNPIAPSSVGFPQARSVTVSRRVRSADVPVLVCERVADPLVGWPAVVDRVDAGESVDPFAGDGFDSVVGRWVDVGVGEGVAVEVVVVSVRVSAFDPGESSSPRQPASNDPAIVPDDASSRRRFISTSTLYGMKSLVATTFP
jgi:hypothetical protein